MQNFELSSELALNVSNRFCNFEFDGKYDFYELLMSNRLIEDNKANKILKLEGNFNNCLFNKQNLEKNQLDNFEQLISADDLQEVLIYFNAHSENEKLSRQLSAFLKFKFWQANESERENMKKDLIILSSKSPQLKLEAVISQYEKVKEFREKTRNLKFIFTTLPKFDDDKFNSELEQYFSIITELNKEAVGLSKDSTPEEVLLIREVLTRPYNSLVNSINNFTPQGVDTKYLEGFKKGMRQITEPLIAKASQIDREKMAIMEKNNFFFEVQKHDKFENIKELNSELKNLNFHSAILFSNTIDLNRGSRK